MNTPSDKWTGEHKKALANVLDTMMSSLDQIGPERMLRAISQLREEATHVKALEVDQNDLDSLSQFADDMRQDYPRMCGTLDRLIIAYGENLCFIGDVQAGCDLVRGGRLYRQLYVKDVDPSPEVKKDLDSKSKQSETNNPPNPKIP